MLKQKITAYLSGPIRGFMGKAVIPEIQQMNINKGITWEKKLWQYFGSQLETYCPHTHDRFPQIAMERGYLTVSQVLAIDCAIVAQCDVLLVMNWENHISSGMGKEIDEANSLGIPVRVFTGVKDDDLRALSMWLERTFK